MVKLLTLSAAGMSRLGMWMLNIMGSMSSPLMVTPYRPTTQPPAAARGQKAGWAMLLSGTRDGNGIERANASLGGQRHRPKSDHLGVLQSGSVPLQDSRCTHGTISGLGPSSAFTDAECVCVVVSSLPTSPSWVPAAVRRRLGGLGSIFPPPRATTRRGCCDAALAGGGNEVTTSMVPVLV
ncbi:hypothetical protein B0T18DRAFT_7339 [Schizothecium vesticola]|uniref:Uncharacterized protein n=1 Tax=Schizothecium vesticola TaxID=314040 RepID=A0AA40F8G1_9PEZI|nr:hypothetical protein B0T18DRAFT_7339 [Schizothecium vesticola]